MLYFSCCYLFISECELPEIASDLLRLAVLGDSSSDKVWCASEIIFSFRLHMSGNIKFKCVLAKSNLVAVVF